MTEPKDPKDEVVATYIVKHPEVEVDQTELLLREQRRKAREKADEEFEHPRKRRERKRWERIKSRRKVRRAIATKQGRISH